MSKVINATQSDFEEVVIKSKIPVLVDFWAPWCGPCRMMAPILDEYSDDMADKVKVVKVDVDEPSNQALAIQYQIRSIPNMKLFKGGAVVHEVIGLRPKEALAEEIESALK
ncbi:MAG: thioredoxin [Patescibacteria group bacterium]|nr:thioredoxin [Patescibacteria group bacterium]